jgi:hypothetical protein
MHIPSRNAYRPAASLSAMPKYVGLFAASARSFASTARTVVGMRDVFDMS